MQLRTFFTFVQAIAIVTGTIVGAGVMGLPYAFMEVGAWWGSVTVVVVGFFMTALMLMVGYVALRSPKDKQLTGYAEYYLGKRGKHLLAIAMMLNIVGAMLAYTIGQGEILSNLMGGSSVVWSYGFFLCLGAVVVLGIDIVKYFELFLTSSILFLFVALIFFTVPEFSWETVPSGNASVQSILVVYGVALAACFGLVSVPQVRNIMQREKPSVFYAAIFVGSMIPVALYILFAIMILGITGTETSPVAVVSLTHELGVPGQIIGSVFAILAMSTSFLALGLALRNVLYRDYNLPLWLSVAITLGVPLSFFIFGVRDFILVLSVVGGVALNIIGVVSVVLFWRAKQGVFQNGRRRFAISLMSTVMFCLFVSSLVMIVADTIAVG